MRRILLLPGALLTILAIGPHAPMAASGQAAAAPAPGQCSINWAGNEAEIEKFITEAKVLKLEDVPIGVTRPQRATLEPGGPMGVTRFAWKPLTPGYYKGFMESYKAEIAAYKLDQLLGMHMVPPTVERRIENKNGAASMWVENTRPWSIAKPPQGPEPGWSIQLTRMKMFDLLIANIDRNQGNLIYDADWHLILIDHSRGFIGKKDLKNIAPIGRVDRQLWEKMQALTLESLEAGLGNLVSTNDKKALLIRRDLMAKQIDELIKKRGEKSVFYD
jgi:hypothetical protein